MIYNKKHYKLICISCLSHLRCLNYIPDCIHIYIMAAAGRLTVITRYDDSNSKRVVPYDIDDKWYSDII